MLSVEDEESIEATVKLLKTRVCLFDLSKKGSRLKLIAFGSHSYNIDENDFRYFASGAACGRWDLVRAAGFFRVLISSGCSIARQ